MSAIDFSTGPKATFREIRFSDQPQFPNYDSLVLELKCSSVSEIPEACRQSGCFSTMRNRDGRSGACVLEWTVRQGEWLITERRIMDIEDNRVVRRREMAMPSTASWFGS
jgi:hypothetical protein